ncbi:MAG TPA: redoxin domain-containing protein [Acidobacteriota bacterium]|nr:redoxin domain-containing protein [Acidobacteriota bacterium]
MNKRSSWLYSLLLITMLGGLSSSAMAQNKQTDSTIDGLVKSIGMIKPSLTRAPDFSLRDTNGAPVSLSGKRGSWVLLNFWATWCGPCRDEMPSMETLNQNFAGQGFTILAVNQKESAAQVTRFMKTHGLNFATPLDSDGRVNAAYRVYGIPVSYLVDGAGNAIGMKSGARDWGSRDVVEALRKLIGAGGGNTGSGGSLALEPATRLPNTLRAKGSALVLHSQQDPVSEVVAKLPIGEEVTPLGKAADAGDDWYMVRTKVGVIGWVRGADVEEAGKGR